MTTRTLPSGRVGNSYLANLTGVDPDGLPVLITLTGLPPSLAVGLCTTSGHEIICPVEGAPAQRGTFTVTATLTDERGGVANKTYRLSIKPGRSPQLLTKNLPDARITEDYQAEITAVDADTADVVSLTITGLPSGLSLESCSGTNTTTCLISGVPTTRGAYSLTATAVDQYGGSAVKRYTLQVR